jgi:hypothetical protein
VAAVVETVSTDSVEVPTKEVESTVSVFEASVVSVAARDSVVGTSDTGVSAVVESSETVDSPTSEEAAVDASELVV